MKSSSGEHYGTLLSMVKYETENRIHNRKGHRAAGCVMLLILHRALGFIIEFLRRLVQCDDTTSVAHVASEVYRQTLAPHHIWIARKMAALAMLTLPNRRRLLHNTCKHEPEEVLGLLDEVVRASQPVYDRVQSVLGKYDLLHLV